MKFDLTGVLASLVIAAVVAVPMVLAGAPTWAWLGVGMLAYLHSFAQPNPRRRR